MLASVNNNKTSFTSVVPIRVFLDNTEVFSPKYIRSATQQLTGVLAGPAKNNEKSLSIIRKFAQHDPDYDFGLGLNGYPKLKQSKKALPSDYFRCIIDQAGTFLFTGLQAKKLREIGESLGKAQQACKAQNVQSSYAVQNAKRNYGFSIMNYLRSFKLRVTEGFNRETKQKTGSPVVLNLHLSSNKKYGQSNFKMTLDDISFSNIEP